MVFNKALNIDLDSLYSEDETISEKNWANLNFYFQKKAISSHIGCYSQLKFKHSQNKTELKLKLKKTFLKNFHIETNNCINCPQLMYFCLLNCFDNK